MGPNTHVHWTGPFKLATEPWNITRLKMLRVLLAIFLLAPVANGAGDEQGGVPAGPFFAGRVEYPNGSPAAGAKVTAEALCSGKPCGGDSAAADSHGNFSIRIGLRIPNGVVIRRFPQNCDKVRFSASHREALWLETGSHVFYLHPNGSEPEIGLLPGKLPDAVVIRLGDRGGEVKIRIWDTGSNRFIHGTVGVERTDTSGRDLGALQTATGDDGAAVSVFLPAGSYVLALEQYPCRGKTYFASHAEFPFEIRAGQRVEKTISVDTHALEAIESYDNPRGEKCGQ